MNINEVLKIYLGTDDAGGFQPIGCEERMRHAFPADFDERMRAIDPYLAVDYTPDWTRLDLIQAGNAFAEVLRKRFPELDEVVVKSLANQFTFSWR